MTYQDYVIAIFGGLGIYIGLALWFWEHIHTEPSWQPMLKNTDFWPAFFTLTLFPTPLLILDWWIQNGQPW
jgi:hypothetical protein